VSRSESSTFSVTCGGRSIRCLHTVVTVQDSIPCRYLHMGPDLICWHRRLSPVALLRNADPCQAKLVTGAELVLLDE
jgi:hypothetical protein